MLFMRIIIQFDWLRASFAVILNSSTRHFFVFKSVVAHQLYSVPRYFCTHNKTKRLWRTYLKTIDLHIDIAVVSEIMF